MNEEKHQIWLTELEIQAICQALERNKHILLNNDLTVGSTYFRIMKEQREPLFNALIDKIKNGEIIKGEITDNNRDKNV